MTEKSRKFKGWKDAQEWLLENKEESCVNCAYGNRGHPDDSAFIFCTEPTGGMCMANLQMGYRCKDWKAVR